MANDEPSKKPKKFLPNNRTDKSSNKASMNMAIIGPKMTALGDIVFSKAQISPERQNNPRSVHL